MEARPARQETLHYFFAGRPNSRTAKLGIWPAKNKPRHCETNLDRPRSLVEICIATERSQPPAAAPGPHTAAIKSVTTPSSSVLFQWSRNIVVRGDTRNLYTSFFGAGVLAILFIVAQMVTWNHLQAGGFYLSSNPAVAFYYLLTGVHALHLIGGLWVWSKCAIRLTSGGEPEEVRLSIQLCTIYWHFLLLVWIGLFAILANT